MEVLTGWSATIAALALLVRAVALSSPELRKNVDWWDARRARMREAKLEGQRPRSLDAKRPRRSEAS